jgi:hypothetical protein
LIAENQKTETIMSLDRTTVTKIGPGRIGRESLKIRKLLKVNCDEEERIVVMKVSTTTVIGILFGFAVGIIGLGQADSISSDLANVAPKIHQYMLWIVFLSLLVPLIVI